MTSAPSHVLQKKQRKHCGPAGVVSCPGYFDMIDDCVEPYFEGVGLPFEECVKSGGLPTAHIWTGAQAPPRHGDRAAVMLDLTRMGGSSLDSSIQAICGDETRVTTALSVVHAESFGRSTPWTGQIRHAFQPNMRSNQ